MMSTQSFTAAAVVGHIETDDVSRLEQFLEEQRKRQSARVVLAQKVGEGLQPVDEWSLGSMHDARSLAGAIHGMAEREAQAMHESVTYGVFAFRADSPAFVARQMFRIEAGLHLHGGVMADTPDERGITSMMMRHTESSARLALGHSREIVDQYQTLFLQEHAQNSRLLDQAHARIRVLEEREAEFLDLREKLHTRAAEQQAVIDAARRKDEMRKYAIDKLGMAVPLVLSAIKAKGLPATGSPVGGAPAPGGPDAIDAAAAAVSANASEELIDRLMMSMTPQMVGEIMHMLEPEQMVLFGKLIELSQARTERKQAAVMAAAAPSAPPAAPTTDPLTSASTQATVSSPTPQATVPSSAPQASGATPTSENAPSTQAEKAGPDTPGSATTGSAMRPPVVTPPPGAVANDTAAPPSASEPHVTSPRKDEEP